MKYQQNTKINYFVFKGVKYAKGTKIEITESLKNKLLSREDNSRIFTFEYQNKNHYDKIFCSYYSVQKHRTTCFYFENNCENIKRIVNPVYYNERPELESAIDNFRTGKKRPDVFHQTVWFICIMCFLVICKNGWFYMMLLLAWFSKWLISQYKD